MRTSDPIHGRRESREPGPAAASDHPIPAASIREHRGDNRRADRNEIAAKVEAVARSRPWIWRRSVPSQEPEGQEPEATAERDQGGLGTHDSPEADRGKPGEDHARQLDRLGWRCVEAAHGDMSPGARQTHDREGRDQPRDAQDRQRPPFRGPAEPKLLRQMRVDALLDLVDQLQEAPGDGRRDHADDRRQDSAASGTPGSGGSRLRIPVSDPSASSMTRPDPIGARASRPAELCVRPGGGPRHSPPRSETGDVLLQLS